eukprot:jgi/Ulvmu1/8368/UM042_0074.1
MCAISVQCRSSGPAEEPPATADLDEPDKFEDIDVDVENEVDGELEDDYEREGDSPLHAIDDAEHHASFTVRHGLQGVDPGITSKLVQAGAIVVAGAALWTLRRLLRRGERLNSENAWAWTTGEVPGPQDQKDLTRPLRGYSIAVAENVPCQDQTPVFGRVSRPAPTAPHHVVRSLTDAGATLCGAARMDARPPHTAALCATCATVGNPGHPGRAVIGAHGALCALTAARSIDIGVAVDSGGDALLPSACMGLYSMRTSSGALPLQSSDLPQPGTSCSAMAFTAHNPALMLKVAKALGLPGSATVDELRVMLAADMFIMTEAIAGEKVTNGIVTRSITTWLSDREHARQVNLLEWLAKELSGWDYFAPAPRGKPDPVQVLLSISAAHKAICDYEWLLTAPEGGWLDDPTAVVEQVETSDYNAALQLRDDLQAAMRKALSPMVLMVVPVLAGAAPRVPGYARPLPPALGAMAAMSGQMTAFVAMAGCPAAVLPVPAVSARGAPWAVLIVGCHRCDLQVANYAAKMGAHIQKTVKAMVQEKKEEKAKGQAKKLPDKPPSAVEKQELADAMKTQGNEAFKAGNYKEAAKFFSAALELTPNNAVLYSNRAQAHINLELFKAAISDCDSSLKCKFTPKAALRRGTACVALGRWRDAITSFEAVLSREPQNMQAQEQLQLCNDMLGKSLQGSSAVADEEGML